MKKLLFTLVGVLVFFACDTRPPTSDQIQNQKQEELSKQAVQEVGLPAIVNYQEKRMFKDILEMRDKAITTWTFFVDYTGHLHLVCHSVGFPVPYSTQYTNPQKLVDPYTAHEGYVAIPQADPNGLFSPASSEGTYELCLDPVKKKTVPIYYEPRFITAPFDLRLTWDK